MFFKSLAQFPIRFHFGKIDIVDNGLDPKACAAADDGELTALQYIFDNFFGLLFEFSDVEIGAGRDDINHVVRDAVSSPRFDLSLRLIGGFLKVEPFAFVSLNFPRSNIHLTENLPAVSGNYFPVELFGQFDGNIGLSRRSRAEDDKEFVQDISPSNPNALAFDIFTFTKLPMGIFLSDEKMTFFWVRVWVLYNLTLALSLLRRGNPSPPSPL